MPPCCALGRFISRHVRFFSEAGSRWHVRVAGSHGPISAGKASEDSIVNKSLNKIATIVHAPICSTTHKITGASFKYYSTDKPTLYSIMFTIHAIHIQHNSLNRMVDLDSGG